MLKACKMLRLQTKQLVKQQTISISRFDDQKQKDLEKKFNTVLQQQKEEEMNKFGLTTKKDDQPVIEQQQSIYHEDQEDDHFVQLVDDRVIIKDKELVYTPDGEDIDFEEYYKDLSSSDSDYDGHNEEQQMLDFLDINDNQIFEDNREEVEMVRVIDSDYEDDLIQKGSLDAFELKAITGDELFREEGKRFNELKKDGLLGYEKNMVGSNAGLDGIDFSADESDENDQIHDGSESEYKDQIDYVDDYEEDQNNLRDNSRYNEAHSDQDELYMKYDDRYITEQDLKAKDLQDLVQVDQHLIRYIQAQQFKEGFEYLESEDEMIDRRNTLQVYGDDILKAYLRDFEDENSIQQVLKQPEKKRYVNPLDDTKVIGDWMPIESGLEINTALLSGYFKEDAQFANEIDDKKKYWEAKNEYLKKNGIFSQIMDQKAVDRFNDNIKIHPINMNEYKRKKKKSKQNQDGHDGTDINKEQKQENVNIGEQDRKIVEESDKLTGQANQDQQQDDNNMVNNDNVDGGVVDHMDNKQTVKQNDMQNISGADQNKQNIRQNSEDIEQLRKKIRGKRSIQELQEMINDFIVHDFTPECFREIENMIIRLDKLDQLKYVNNRLLIDIITTPDLSVLSKHFNKKEIFEYNPKLLGINAISLISKIAIEQNQCYHGLNLIRYYLDPAQIQNMNKNVDNPLDSINANVNNNQDENQQQVQVGKDSYGRRNNSMQEIDQILNDDEDCVLHLDENQNEDQDQDEDQDQNQDQDEDIDYGIEVDQDFRRDDDQNLFETKSNRNVFDRDSNYIYDDNEEEEEEEDPYQKPKKIYYETNSDGEKEEFVLTSDDDKGNALDMNEMYSEDFEDFWNVMAQYGDSKFNKLSYVHTYNRMSQRYLVMDLDDKEQMRMMELFHNVYWGANMDESNIKLFRKHLIDSLNNTLKVQSNTGVRLFLFDCFFQPDNYEEGLHRFSLMVMILNRLYNKDQNLNDLYENWLNKFGEVNFTTYISRYLGQLLDSRKTRPVYLAYCESMINYDRFKKEEQYIKEQEDIGLKKQMSKKQINDAIFGSKAQMMMMVQTSSYLDKQYFTKDSYIHVSYENCEFEAKLWAQETKEDQQQGDQEQSDQENDYVDDDFNQRMQNAKDMYLYRERNLVLKQLRQNFLLENGSYAQDYLKRDKKQDESEYFYDMHAKDVNRRMVQNAMPVKYLSECKISNQLLSQKVRKYYSTKRQQDVDQVDHDSAEVQYNDQQYDHQNQNNQKPKEESGFLKFLKVQQQIDKQKELNFQNNKLSPKFQSGFLKSDGKNQQDSSQNQDQQGTSQNQGQENRQIRFENQQKLETLRKLRELEESLQVEMNVNEIKIEGKQTNSYRNDIQQKMGQLSNKEAVEYLQKMYIGLQDIEDLAEKQKNMKVLVDSNMKDKEDNRVNGLNVMMELFFYGEHSANINQSRLVLQQVLQGEQFYLDFNRYLKHDVFKFRLSQDTYSVLLEFLALQYNRKLFKKLMGHMILHCQEINHKNIGLVVDICMKQKMGFSLLQIQLLMVQNKIKYSESSFKLLIDSLNKFRNINVYVMDIINSSLMYQNYGFSFELLESYIDDKIKRGKQEQVMILFESVRDQFLNEKMKYSVETMDEEQKDQQKQIQNEKTRQMLKQVYRQLIRKLNRDYKSLKWSQLLLQDMVNNKMNLESEDYENLIDAHRMNPAHIIRIYKNMTADESILIDAKMMSHFMKVVYVNEDKMIDFFEKMMKDYIFSQRMQIDIDLVIEAAKVFTKIRNNTLFVEFIEFLQESDIQFNYGIQKQKRIFDQLNSIYTKDNKSIRAKVNSLLGQERYFRLKQKASTISDSQREMILEKMNLKQRELMKKESQMYKEYDQEKIKQLRKEFKKVEVKPKHRLNVEEEIDDLQYTNKNSDTRLMEINLQERVSSMRGQATFHDSSFNNDDIQDELNQMNLKKKKKLAKIGDKSALQYLEEINEAKKKKKKKN